MDKMDNKSSNNTGRCSCGCDHAHEHPTHDNLYGCSDELPAVFSHTVQIKFSKVITKEELKTRIVEWISNLKQWVLQNKYFIGHIKVFADNSEGLNLWFSTTGRNINVKDSTENASLMINRCTVNITAIVIGPKEQVLKQLILEKFNNSINE